MDLSTTLHRRTEAVLSKLNPEQHLENLNYPRRSGTQGEQRAADYISRVLSDIGLTVSIQPFHYTKPKPLGRIVPGFVFLSWMLLSLININLPESHAVFTLALRALSLILIFALINFGQIHRLISRRRMKALRDVERDLSDGSLDVTGIITSQNVIAEIGPEDAEQQILFTAHFDSISSKLPAGLLRIAFGVGIGGFVLFSLAYLANTISGRLFGLYFMQTYPQVFTALGLIVSAGLVVFFLSRLLRGNDSHGIIDDGTGVAILLELARVVKDHSLPGTKYIFGLFGSEEAGLIGSTAYYIHQKVDKNKLRVISIDMIGEKPPLAYIKRIALIRKAWMEPTFNKELASIADAFDIKIEGKNFPYPGSDFAPFMLEGGCDANWLMNQSRLIHSKNDHLGNVNVSLVNDALKLLVGYVLLNQEEHAK